MHGSFFFMLLRPPAAPQTQRTPTKRDGALPVAHLEAGASVPVWLLVVRRWGSRTARAA